MSCWLCRLGELDHCMPIRDIRACVLQVIADQTPIRPGDGNLQSSSVLREVQSRFDNRRDHGFEQALLTVFHELFRTGYLAWGFNLANPNPPFFHITEQGVQALARLSRDPSNPKGYRDYLTTRFTPNPIALSYIDEAIACFTNNLPKACAVMIGCASESIILELRDAIVARLESTGRVAPRPLSDWRIKIVADSAIALLQENVRRLPRELKEPLDSFGPAFLQQIRAARNDAGHPSDVAPVTFETAHASLLMLPDLGSWITGVRDWINANL